MNIADIYNTYKESMDDYNYIHTTAPVEIQVKGNRLYPYVVSNLFSLETALVTPFARGQ